MPSATTAKAERRSKQPRITLTPKDIQAVSEFLESADNLLAAAWSATSVLQVTMCLILDQADNAGDPEVDGSLVSGELLAAADVLDLLRARLHEMATRVEQIEDRIPESLRHPKGGRNGSEEID